MRTSFMTDRLWMLNKIIKLATTPTSSHWLGQKQSNYKKRWIYSLIVMSMYLLRIIYYLIVVHYLCSGLKNMQCLTRLLRVQRKATWRRRVAVSDSDFQVRDEFCTNPRSFTLSILYHWRHLEVNFPMQLTDHDLELCSKRYDWFSGDCSRCPVPLGPTDRVQTLLVRTDLVQTLLVRTG